MAVRIVPGLPTATAILNYVLDRVSDLDGGRAATTFTDTIEGGIASSTSYPDTFAGGDSLVQ